MKREVRLASTPILNAVPNLATFGLAAPFDSFRMELESFKGRVQSALMNNGGRDIQDIRRRIELLSITPQLSEGDPIVGQTIALVERMIALAEQSFAYTNDRAAAVHIAVLASEVVPKLFSNRDPSFSIPKTKKLEIVDDLNDGLI